MNLMSNRPCNLCLFRRLQASAAKNGWTVEVRPKPLEPDMYRGVDVFVEGKWAAWYAGLPEECSC